MEAKVVHHDLSVEEVEKPVKERITHSFTSEKHTNHNDLNELITTLHDSAGQVENVPGFKKLSVELIQKAERLQNQSFTVALFGAFSAGKSSFANALIGDSGYCPFHPIRQRPPLIKLCLLMILIRMEWCWLSLNPMTH